MGVVLMLKSARFIHIQGHEDSILEFSKGLNIIKGTSHHGKSTLVRGMTAGIENSPPLSSLKTTLFPIKKDEASMLLTFDDGEVERRIDKNKNSYIVNGEILNAMKKSEVPDEVSKVTRMNDTNIQTQFRRFFMLQDSPGARAKAFNEAANLTIIDEKIRSVNSIVSTAKKDEKQHGIDITHTEKGIKEYGYLDGAGKLIAKIDSEIEERDETIRIKNEVASHIETIESLESVLEEKRKFLEVEPKLIALKELISNGQELADRFQIIKNKVLTIEDLEAEVEEDEEFLEAEPRLEALKELIQERTEMHLTLESIRKLCDSIDTAEKHAQKSNQTIIQLDIDILSLKKQHKASLQSCPTCGSLRKHWTKEELL